MEERYSVDDILKAVEDLQNLNNIKKNKFISKRNNNFQSNKNIPNDTLKLIEEAERVIKSKTQSE
tara:strand:- start:595 stop:789 length:195 start_codon:yes stop_codon:yes gene_type:complete